MVINIQLRFCSLSMQITIPYSIHQVSLLHSTLPNTIMSRGWPYHTFVSFRGEDIRYGFIGHLRHNLQQRGIRLFMDDEIRKGENITDTLIEAIEDSQTAIIVFSKNYASSSFCLRELVHIQRCMQGHARTIWVIFFDVDPSDVRHQKNSYETAFQRYDNDKIKYDEKEVNDWRFALTKAADLCGWHWDSSSKTYEFALMEEIIDAMSNIINQRHIFIARFPVGLKSQVEEVCKHLNLEPNDDGATTVGIWGTGGIGKTTLARALYNEIGKDFKHLCFLANIRQHSIRELAKTMLSQTLWEKGDSLDNVDEHTIPAIIKDRLWKKKVLLILDDICELKQLQALVGEPNWFGRGSKIIITTRDLGLLLRHNIDISRTYNVELLKPDQAGELLRLHAFGKNFDPKYKDVIDRAVKYAGGLPLVLEVLGSHLSAYKTLEDWEDILDMYEKVPEKTILENLKVSYDNLEKIHKEIFLDIACFYRGFKLKHVTKMLSNSHNFRRPEFCIRVLIERSLLKIDDHNSVQMHDLIQDMGKAIVMEESTELGQRSRLWSTEDFRDVLVTKSGSGSIQAIKFNLNHFEDVKWWNGEAFKKMTCLRQLIIDSDVLSDERPLQYLPNSLRVLKWKYFPFLTLPHDFHPCNLAILHFNRSKLQTLEEPSRNFGYLRRLNLILCENLKEIPNMSSAANLEILKVTMCGNLTKIDDSIGHLDKLKKLKATYCSSLKTFIMGGIKLPSLEILNLSGCYTLEKFPQILGEMENIKILSLDYCDALTELPESIEKLVGLEYLSLSSCRMLGYDQGIPINKILKLRKLQIFVAPGCKLSTWSRSLSLVRLCTEIEGNNDIVCNILLFKILSLTPNLKVLDISGSNIKQIPKFINNCHSLTHLSLVQCFGLREMSGIPPNIQTLSAPNCTSFTSHSRRRLLSQELHKTGRTRFILPGENIPEWFHKQSEGDSVCFGVRNKFPNITVCVVFHYVRETHLNAISDIEFEILLNNGGHLIIIRDPHPELRYDSDLVYMFHLKSQEWLCTFQSEVLQDEWNGVVIKCNYKEGYGWTGLVKCIGVFACNYEECKDDVDWEYTGSSREARSDQAAKQGGDDKQETGIIYMDIPGFPKIKS